MVEVGGGVCGAQVEVGRGGRRLASFFPTPPRSHLLTLSPSPFLPLHCAQERKNTHINELMKKHERAFAEIKNYYNDITHNNLDLIKTLKEDVAEMKKREAQNEKLM